MKLVSVSRERICEIKSSLVFCSAALGSPDKHSFSLSLRKYAAANESHLSLYARSRRSDCL